MNETTQIYFDFDKASVNFKRRIWARLRLGDKDLLGSEDEENKYHCFDRLWIHSFATAGMANIIKCKSHKVVGLEFFEGWGEFDFRSKGDNILIFASTIEEVFKVPGEDFLKVWKEFGSRVYAKVVERHPEMKEYFKWAGIVDPYEFKYERSADESLEGEWDKSWFEEDDGRYADFW
jgi:hypothetical protein